MAENLVSTRKAGIGSFSISFRVVTGQQTIDQRNINRLQGLSPLMGKEDIRKLAKAISVAVISLKSHQLENLESRIKQNLSRIFSIQQEGYGTSVGHYYLAKTKASALNDRMQECAGGSRFRLGALNEEILSKKMSCKALRYQLEIQRCDYKKSEQDKKIAQHRERVTEIKNKSRQAISHITEQVNTKRASLKQQINEQRHRLDCLAQNGKPVSEYNAVAKKLMR